MIILENERTEAVNVYQRVASKWFTTPLINTFLSSSSLRLKYSGLGFIKNTSQSWTLHFYTLILINFYLHDKHFVSIFYARTNKRIWECSWGLNVNIIVKLSPGSFEFVWLPLYPTSSELSWCQRGHMISSCNCGWCSKSTLQAK